MIQFRYILQPYKGLQTRFHCPACNSNERTFSRYIDSETGECLSPSVGRCNRQINCGYHYTPKQFFDSNKQLVNPDHRKEPKATIKDHFKPPSYIAKSVFEQSLQYTNRNNFIDYLLKLFGAKLSAYLVKKYFIGSAKHWLGATVFWQIDEAFSVRTGKIILYDPDTGHRIKKPFNHIAWAHALLKIQDFNLQQCFFGEHLLKKEHNKPIAIVESEKTAIVASVYMPQLVWLACGGINELTTEKFTVLSGRKIILFPDLNGFKKWKQRSFEIQNQVSCQISVSELLEINASPKERLNGLDIADYLIKRDNKFGWALSCENYPLFWDI